MFNCTSKKPWRPDLGSNPRPDDRNPDDQPVAPPHCRERGVKRSLNQTITQSYPVYDGSVVVDVHDAHGDVDTVKDARRLIDEDTDVEHVDRLRAGRRLVVERTSSVDNTTDTVHLKLTSSAAPQRVDQRNGLTVRRLHSTFSNTPRLGLQSPHSRSYASVGHILTFRIKLGIFYSATRSSVVNCESAGQTSLSPSIYCHITAEFRTRDLLITVFV